MIENNSNIDNKPKNLKKIIITVILIIIFLVTGFLMFYKTNQSLKKPDLKLPNQEIKDSTKDKDKTLEETKEKYIEKMLELPSIAYDEEEVKNIIKRIEGFNIKFLKKLSDSNVSIRLINGSLTDEPEYRHLKGVVPRGWENSGSTWDDIPGCGGQLTIIRIGYSFPSIENNHGAIVLELHEISHAINMSLDFISDSKEFIQIKNEERNKLFGADADYYDINEEYFAEALAMYSYNSESISVLKNNAPKTYDFFTKLINSLFFSILGILSR